MGTDTTNLGAGKCARLPQKPGRQRRGAGIALALSLSLMAQVAAAQTPPEAAPPVDEAAKALALRVEALEKLASGTLPQIPLDSLLGVSLDDDSSMIERDGEARFERRRLTIALNQAERQGNKSPAELQLLRDQILALDLERKVLALPIEVRERLIAEQYKQPSSPAPPEAVDPEPASSDKPPPAAEAAPATEPAKSEAPATAPASAQAPDERPWLSGWLLFIGLLAVTFAVARVVGALARRGQQVGSDERRTQLSALVQLGIYAVGFLGALLVSFQLSPELDLLVYGALALIIVFAGKDVARSLLGGLFLLAEPPFRVGHRIEIGGVEGRVAEMGLLSVRMVGAQQKSIHVPNSEFLTKLVSASPPSGILTPLQIDFYIHPQDDIAHAKNIITEVIQSTRGADAPKARTGILVSQVPVNGVVMVRLRTKIFVTGTHPEQEIASEVSERVIARLQGKTDVHATHESDPPDEDSLPSAHPAAAAARGSMLGT